MLWGPPLSSHHLNVAVQDCSQDWKTRAAQRQGGKARVLWREVLVVGPSRAKGRTKLSLEKRRGFLFLARRDQLRGVCSLSSAYSVWSQSTSPTRQREGLAAIPPPPWANPSPTSCPGKGPCINNSANQSV